MNLNFLAREYSPSSAGGAFVSAFRSWGQNENETADLKFRLKQGETPLRFLSHLFEQKENLLLLSLEDDVQDVIYERICRLWPSVVLFHDLNFSSAVLSRFQLGTYPEPLYAELESRFGSGQEIIADSHVRGWGVNGFTRSLRWALPAEKMAAFPIVTSQSLLRVFPGAEYCPIPVSLSHSPQTDSSAIRSRLGLAEDCLIVGFAPRFDLQDRSELVREIIAQKKANGANLHLLELADEWHPEAWEASLKACDIFIGLRADETRGVSVALLQALGLGKPCLFSFASPSNAELPPSVGLAIRPGFSEGAEIDEAIQVLLETPELRARLAEEARSFILREHHPDRVKQRLLSLLRPRLEFLLAGGKIRRESASINRTALLFSGAGEEKRPLERLHRRAAQDFSW